MKLTIDQIIDQLKRDKNFMARVSSWQSIPAKEPKFGGNPAKLDNIILNALKWRAGADSISNVLAKMPEDLSGLIEAVAG